uniref:Uncharacterized protein n=1 Tax=Arundo donax TaxID=35708 RepID=A0A0A9THC9_ARUDO
MFSCHYGMVTMVWECKMLNEFILFHGFRKISLYRVW